MKKLYQNKNLLDLATFCGVLTIEGRKKDAKAKKTKGKSLDVPGTPPHPLGPETECFNYRGNGNYARDSSKPRKDMAATHEDTNKTTGNKVPEKKVFAIISHSCNRGSKE